MAPLRPCAEPGCPTLVGRGRCPAHSRRPFARRRTSPRRYDGAEYRRNRLAVLERAGYACEAVRDGQRCGRATRTVDHIDRLGGDETSNLRAICTGRGSCHSAKTSTEALASRKAVAR